MFSSKALLCYRSCSLPWYFRQVMGRCKKSLGAGKEVVIDASTINAIFSRWSSSFTSSLSWLPPSPSVVALSESEPYGIRGGSLVVLFAPAPNSEDSPVEVTLCRFSVLNFLAYHTLPNHASFLQIGKFPLDPCTLTTFELYLTIQVFLNVDN